MTNESAEETAHTYAYAVVVADVGTTIRIMTPDGLASAMLLGNTDWTYLSYELASAGADGDDQLFEISFVTDSQPVTMRYRFRNIRGEWKIVEVVRGG